MENNQPALIIPTSLTLSNRSEWYEISLLPITKNPQRHTEKDHIVVHLSDCNKNNRLTISLILNSTTIQQWTFKDFIIQTLTHQINNISNNDIEELHNRWLINAKNTSCIPYGNIRNELIHRIQTNYSELAIKWDDIPQEYMLQFTNLFWINHYYKEIYRTNQNTTNNEQIGEC